MRSGCPINLSLELLGDRWTLLVLRDVIFADSRRFRELLDGPERISSNVLADRLATLVEHGLLTRSADPTHKQKITYSLSEQAIQLVPVFAHLGMWGAAHLPAAEVFTARTEVLARGGPPLWEEFMDELRETHLGPQARRAARPEGVTTVRERMDAASLAALDEAR